MLESKIEARLVALVARHGGLALKFVSPGNSGVPDRLVLMPCGCHRLVELKAPGERPRPLQSRMFAKLEALSHPVAVLDTIAAVDEYVGALALHAARCGGTLTP